MAVHEKLRVTPSADELALRRMFVSIQIAKAGIGAALALLFAALIGRPDMAEALAFAGLLAPAALAALAFTRIPLAILEQAALAVFASLIGYLAALTGGVSSPLIVWLVLVPAEAALAGGRPAVRARGGCGGDCVGGGRLCAGARPFARLAPAVPCVGDLCRLDSRGGDAGRV